MDCMAEGKYFNLTNVKVNKLTSNSLTNTNDCYEACSFCMQGLAVPLVKRGSEKLHGTWVLGLASGIRFELDCKGHHRQPKQCSVGVFMIY